MSELHLTGAIRQRLDELPDVLTVEETAGVLRISRGLAFEMVREGRIASVRLGRRILVPKAGLMRLLDRGP